MFGMGEGDPMTSKSAEFWGEGRKGMGRDQFGRSQRLLTLHGVPADSSRTDGGGVAEAATDNPLTPTSNLRIKKGKTMGKGGHTCQPPLEIHGIGGLLPRIFCKSASPLIQISQPASSSVSLSFPRGLSPKMFRSTHPFPLP